MEEAITYRIIRSSRKTIAIQITPVGEVIVRSPSRMRAEDIRKFVESKRSWIEKHLSRKAAEPAPAQLTQEEIRALARQAAKVIPARIAHFAPLVGVDYGRITIRRQRTRWGSCSGKGNLNFNCLLMLTPPEVLDYVVVHELCHRKELNHSVRFWAEVVKILPDYRVRRDWLKDNGDALICRLPGVEK